MTSVSYYLGEVLALALASVLLRDLTGTRQKIT
jgi:hypothetical protein